VPKLKSHKTVEQIAKKHRLDVSFIQNQLDMGEPIEHEHTKDHDLARDIALQHLDEIPDYYTRLKKMEASAKKEHKKFKDVTEGNLHKWFKSKSKDGKPGWVNVVTGGTCASDEPGEGIPKCVSSKKRASMSKEERLSAARRKKTADPGQQQKTGAAKPTYVQTDKPKKSVKEEWSDKYKKSIDCDNPKGFSQRAHCQGKKKKMNEESDKKGKNSGKKDACYHKVKARYDVWPSAYASGALVKCRQKGASNWGTKTEEVNSIRYCPKCGKNESRSECKYGEKYWDMFSLPITLGKKYDANSPHPGNIPESNDHEYSMARSEISTIISAAKRLKKKMKGEGNIEAWVQSKITKAADYLDSAADYVDSGEMKTESVSNEPKLKPGSGLGGGKPVHPPGKEPKPTGAKLFPLAKGEGGSPREPYNPPKGPSQPTQPQGGFDKFRKEYGIPKKPSLQIAHFVPHNDAVDEQVKPIDTNYDKHNRMVNAAMAISNPETKRKLLLRAADFYKKNVKPVDENITLQDAEGNDFVEIIDIIKPEKMKGSVSEKCWDGYAQKGMKKKGNRLVPNCIKKEEYSNWREELFEDWQKVNRKDKTDGLSQKAVDAYRRENPGSKLQTAVTEKKPTGKRAERRSNFCSRMKGMKSKLTSAKTARDPDSRINKALRRWNCN